MMIMLMNCNDDDCLTWLMYVSASYLCCCVVLFFFFKQKTAYEMRISDWSSDVCSSDLLQRAFGTDAGGGDQRRGAVLGGQRGVRAGGQQLGDDGRAEIGRASCRERVCQYV